LRLSRKKHVEAFSYTKSERRLENVSDFCDLGVALDSKPSFFLHINNIVCKANKMLGFVSRICCDFSEMRVFIMLYSSFIRSLLEYCTIIRSPCYRMYIATIEKVQKKFVKFICLKFNIFYNRDYYHVILGYLGLVPLINRRIMFDAYFIFKVLSSFINSSDVVSLFKVHVPGRRVGGFHLFHIAFHRTQYGSNSAICRLARLTRQLGSVEWVGISYSQFKNQIRQEIGKLGLIIIIV
jgi:hypothetical protein